MPVLLVGCVHPNPAGVDIHDVRDCATKRHRSRVNPTGAYHVLSRSDVDFVRTAMGRFPNRANRNVADAEDVTQLKLQRHVLVVNTLVVAIRVAVVQVLASTCSILGVAAIKQVCE